MACLVDPGASFDNPGTPGGGSIEEIHKSFKIFFDNFVTVAPPFFLKMLPKVQGH